MSNCPFGPHLGACAELTDYADERIKALVFARLDNPHPCPNCGDTTCADICAACQEDESASVIRGMVHQAFDTEFAPYGWAA